MKKVFLVIDSGTTKIKAALIASNGREIDMVSECITTHTPFLGASEMDMNEVWQTVCKAVCRLHQNNQSVWNNIVGVGVTAQGDGAWLVDKDGNPVCDAILWNDTRAKAMVDLDYDAINKMCAGYCTTPLFAGAAPIILKWIKANHPDKYEKIHMVLHCKDWINFKMTGQLATDWTDASTSLTDIFTNKYVYEILDALDIAETKGKFPQILSPTDIVGRITPQAMKQLHIKAGTPVIVGALDVIAVAVGCNVTESGEKGSILGTTLCNYVALDRQDVKNDYSVGSILCHTKKGKYIRLMAALSGASTLDWVQREILNKENYADIELKVAKIPIGSQGVFYHPYVFGERAPFRNDFACGGFYGITASHTKYHLARAAYEGLALSMYDCYNHLPQGKSGINVAGGASQSDMLCQIISDCLGQPVIRKNSKELGITGIGEMMRIAWGFSEITNISDEDNVCFKPNYTNHMKYKQLYRTFINLRQYIAPFWEERMM